MKLSIISLHHIFLFCLFLVSYVRGRFGVEKTSITVLSPRTMMSKHDASVRNFGLPSYGGFIVGYVVYPKEGSRGCQPFEGDKPSFKFPSHRPTILLLDRGGCYFTLKAWHAQQAGAAAVLVVDDIEEPLINIDSPEEGIGIPEYIKKIQIPSALVMKSFGETLKEALNKNDQVLLRIDLRQSVPHPGNRVEYEFWTNIMDGATWDGQMKFVKNFKGHAQILEKGGYTLFTPHYISWYCPEPFVESSQCKSQCINKGRYCAPDPGMHSEEGYKGKDAVYENLRQLCVHRVATESSRPWVWWDYVTDFHIRCSFKGKKYTRYCAHHVMKSLDLPIDKINNCVGDPEADVENEMLKNEQQLLIGHGSRGDVTILPTLVINNVQYRGKLERKAILKAICSEFKETTEPPVCLSGGLGPASCSVNNGGCWSETKNGLTYSACLESINSGCQCPVGFRGDGYNKCEDVDECKEGSACQCDDCTCKNTWGGYHCNKGNKEHDVRIDTTNIRLCSEILFKVRNFILSLFSFIRDI